MDMTTYSLCNIDGNTQTPHIYTQCENTRKIGMHRMDENTLSHTAKGFRETIMNLYTT